jgi:hypothetical protein
MGRSKACYELREKGFNPNATLTQLGRKMEIVSYPFPNARGGMSSRIAQMMKRQVLPLSFRAKGIL